MKSLVNRCENYIELFDCIVNLFVRVAFSQFRRDYLFFVKKEKGKALRKGVSQKSHKNVKTFNMQFIKEDKSEGKAVSHLRLKSELTNNKNFLVEKSFTKKDLLLLCKAYKVKVSAKKKEGSD